MKNLNRIEYPLDNLSYFMEWGGSTWERLFLMALENYVGTDLSGMSVLDIGTRYGKIASLFALLGGEVTGTETDVSPLEIAAAEAEKWGVAERVKLFHYDGDLDIFPDQSFDLVFTKSVLVTIPMLQDTLLKISRKLKPQGKVVFIENSKGNAIFHALRRFRHRKWDFRRANYFTPRELALFSEIFEIHTVEKAFWPPVYLILGRKRSG